MKDEIEEQMDAQEDRQLRVNASQSALRHASEHKERTVHNANFLNELRKVELDTGIEREKSVEEEYPTWFSGVQAVTNRGDDWGVSSDLAMQNKRERAVTERSPGRLLRDRPFLRATMNGDESPGLDAYARDDIPGGRQYWREALSSLQTSRELLSSKDKQEIYGAAEVAADLMSLSRNAAGLDAVSTVKTETSVRKSEEDESTAEKAGRFLG